MHGGRGFMGRLYIFLNAVRTWELWNASDFFCMRLSRLAGGCSVWQGLQAGTAKGPAASESLKCKLRQTKAAPVAFHLLSPGVSSAAFPLQLPASPGSAEITFGSRSAPARLSIKWGRRIPGGSKARFSVCLIYGPSLAWYNGSPAVNAFTSFYRMSFWDMKGGSKNTLQWWWLTYCISGYN